MGQGVGRSYFVIRPSVGLDGDRLVASAVEKRAHYLRRDSRSRADCRRKEAQEVPPSF
jgi:hypothetical protein